MLDVRLSSSTTPCLRRAARFSVIRKGWISWFLSEHGTRVVNGAKWGCACVLSSSDFGSIRHVDIFSRKLNKRGISFFADIFAATLLLAAYS